MRLVWNRIIPLLILFLAGLTTNRAVSQSGEETLDDVRVWLQGLGINYSVTELETIPWLDLSGSTIDDNDLRHLSALKSLTKLDLRNTSITDEGLRALAQIPTLEVLWLEDTEISDNGLQQLERIESLKEVYLPDQIAEEAVASWQSRAPDLKIHYNAPIGSDPMVIIVWSVLGFIVVAIFLLVFFKATFIQSKGGRVAFTFGIYFFLLFLILLVDAIHFVNVAVYANGRVTELVMKTSSSSDHGTSITYHPKIQFTAADNNQYDFVSEMGSNPPSYEEGEPVQVMYDPERPNEAEIHSGGGIFAVFSYPLIMLIFAVILSASSGALKPVFSKISRMRNPDRILVQEWLASIGVNKTFEELGNKYWCDIKLKGKQFNNEDLVKLKGIRKLTLLDLAKSSVTDAGLVHIGKLDTITNLDLSKTGITDDGLVHLGNLKELEYLDLSKNNIRGRGLSHLKKLTKLKDIELDGTLVDDNCVDELLAISALEGIKIYDTNVTEQGAKKLQRSLTNGHVWWGYKKSNE